MFVKLSMKSSTKMLIMMVIVVVLIDATEAVVYSGCFPSGYCFYTNAELVHLRSREQLSAQCQALENNSRPLELHTRQMQIDLKSFLDRQNLKFENVFMNLVRVDQKWTWLDGTPYTRENGKPDVKKYHIDAKSQPFGFVNRLSHKLLLDKPSSVKSHLSELHGYLCSFNGPCDRSSRSNKFQVDNICYEFHRQDSVNWLQAYNKCSDYNTSLAIIPSNLLSKFKEVTETQLRENHPYWIGLSKMRWEWLSRPGQLVAFNNWYQGYPHPNTINSPPSQVFAYVQPTFNNIWKDGFRNMNASLVCLTKSADEKWINYVRQGVDSVQPTSQSPSGTLPPACTETLTWNSAKTALTAIPVVLGLLLVASLVANVVLAVVLCKKPKQQVSKGQDDEKKGKADEFFHYG